ncbi:MAG: GNAT family N-acetyltransferase [Microvirga sp.]
MISFRPVTPDLECYDALLRESLSEGHAMLQRLGENWLNGTNRFSKPGEILLGAFDGAALLGVCGRNIDPYGDDPGAGRVRHLYVARSGRKFGVGRGLVIAIAEDAKTAFNHLNARAPKPAFGFYERLGFKRIENDPFVTHRLNLTQRISGGS